MEPAKFQHVGIAAVSRPGDRWEGKIALLTRQLTPSLAEVAAWPLPGVESCRDAPTNVAGVARTCPLGKALENREEGKYAGEEPIRL